MRYWASATFEPWTGGAGFYADLFVVPNCTGDLQNLHSVLHNELTISTYLLLRCLLSKCMAAYRAS